MQVTRSRRDNVFVFPALPDTGLHGQIAMALAWWYDDEDDVDDLLWAIEHIPALLAGHTDDWKTLEWWPYYDALGSLTERTPEIERVYRESLKHVFRPA